jgi:hypothetical protein
MSDDQTITGEHASEDSHAPESYGGSGKRLPIQLGIVVGVLAVTGGVIYWMHVKGIAPGKLLKPVEMRYTIEQTQARYYEGEDRIMRTLAQAGPPPQIPLEDIQENPFRLERAPQDSAPTIAFETAPVRDQVLVQAEAMLGSLKIEMVLNNDTNPLAKINGTVYRVGDKVDGVLEIVSISGRSVTFRAKTLMRTLEMESKH